jgi:predicted dehydrogenase
MLRLGLVDFDTSHVVEFTRRLHHQGVAPEQWVEGARVVAGCPGTSQISPERIPGYTEELRKLGVELVEKPADLIGRIDAVMVESVDGSVHRERATPFLEAGLPCYVDKPFTCSAADARALVELAAKKNVPIFSSSSLRYAPEVVRFTEDAKHGQVLGCLTYGPCSEHPRNPGLFHYGIHAVELLYTLMGPGCRRVTATHEKDADVVTGQWADGRLATVRGIRSGKADYGCVAFTEKGVVTVPVGTQFIYRELLKQIVTMFQTKKPPLEPAVTVEIVAFIEAAGRSAANHGAGETVKV